MKLFKKAISLLLAICIFISIFTGCSTLNLNNVEKAITKAEWIENVGRYFGMDDYQSKTSLFQDLTAEDSVYPYAQSCAEWNVIAQSGKFNPDKKVTKEYALATCVYGLGADKTGISIDNSTTKQAAKYAYENGIAQSTSWIYLHQGVTIEEAEQFLQSTLKMLSTYLYPQYNNSKYSEKVKIPAQSEEYTIAEDENSLTFDNPEDVEKYKAGDILVLKRDGIDTPTKIKSIYEDGGKAVVEVETPSMEEIYDNVDVSSIGTVIDPSKIKVNDGFELSSFKTKSVTPGAGEQAQATNLSDNPIQSKKNNFHAAAIGGDTAYETGNEQAELKQTWIGDYEESARIEAADFSFDVTVKPGSTPKVSVGAEVLDGAVSGKAKIAPNGDPIRMEELSEWADAGSIPEKRVEAIKDLEETKWVEPSVSITGKVEIKDFYVQASVKGNVFDWGSTEVKINTNFKVETSVTLKGKADLNRDIGELPIQLGSTPFKLSITLALVGGLNGSVTVKWSVSQNTTIEYSHGNVQKHTDKDFSKSLEFKGKLEFSVGPRLYLSIGVLGYDIDILNLTLSIGFSLTGKVTWANVLRCSDGNNYLVGGDEDKPEVAAAGITFEDAALVCTDVEWEFPIIKLSFCDSSSTILSKFVSFDAVIVGKNGLIKIKPTNWHWENFQKVSECSLGSLDKFKYEDEKEEEESTATDAETSENSGFGTGYFNISTYAVNMAVGAQQTVDILGLPEGMNLEDVTVSVEDGSVASANISADKVVVTGLSKGTTTMKIACGQKELQCVIMVTE